MLFSSTMRSVQEVKFTLRAYSRDLLFQKPNWRGWRILFVSRIKSVAEPGNFQVIFLVLVEGRSAAMRTFQKMPSRVSGNIVPLLISEQVESNCVICKGFPIV